MSRLPDNRAQQRFASRFCFAIFSWSLVLGALSAREIDHLVGVLSQQQRSLGGFENADALRWLTSPAGQNKLRNCLSEPSIPLADKNLTAAEKEVLPSICWRRDVAARPNLKQHNRRGIPIGVKCNATKWCDGADNCSEVCKRGTVQIEPWLQHALKTQLALARQQSMCLATLPGTHNSGITLADGYGNLDPQFQEYFSWIKWIADDARLRTNDHYFSLTDQMNLGVRAVELDTHQVEGALRIAHCGGYHGDLNYLITAVNVVAKLLGHPIHWDTETIGCNPSLSSIPVMEQRTFLSALKEIAAWLDQPGNGAELLVLYLDDQPDLAAWGVLPQLLQEIQSVFPLESIFTPLELDTQFNGTWPSIDKLSSLGKRVAFVTGYDYGTAIDAFMFSKEGRKTICGWREPEFRFWIGDPDCLADGNPFTGPTLAGTLFRILTCDLYYGPMNCDFVWSDSNENIALSQWVFGTNNSLAAKFTYQDTPQQFHPLLDEYTLPDVSQCGVNMPSPDLLTPQTAASTIWSWAVGEPFGNVEANRQPILKTLLQWRSWVLKSLYGEKQCAAISAKDGRWKTVSCSASLPTACRTGVGKWTLGSGSRGKCPSNTTFELPGHARENAVLKRLLQGKNGTVIGAFLPLEGDRLFPRKQLEKYIILPLSTHFASLDDILCTSTARKDGSCFSQLGE